MAIERDLVIEQGESTRTDWQWASVPTQDSPSVPVDLTDCTFTLQARAIPSLSSPLLLELTTDNGGIEITDPLTGKFSIYVTDELSYTLQLPAEPTNKRAYYELVCNFPNGEKRKLLKGQVVFYRAAVYP